MKHGIPIRASLTILVLATALPFVILIAFNTYSQAKIDVQDASAEALRAARAVATETEDTINRAQQLLSSLAKRPLVRSLDATNCAPVFGAFSELYPEYTNLLTVGKDGERVCSATPPPSGAPAKINPELFLAETLRSRAFTVGQVSRGVFSGRWITILAHPLMDERDEIQGVVAVAIDLASLRLARRPAELPNQAEARVVDMKGTVIASSIAPEKWIGQSFADVPWFKLLDPQQAPTGRAADVDGVERIYGTVPIKKTTWRAAVGIPVDVVYEPVRNRLTLNVGYSLVALALAALLAYITALRTVRPVEAIAEAVRQTTQSMSFSANGIAHADMSAAPREIRTLAGDFRSMLEARTAAELELRESDEELRLLNATLEARVEERTHQLERTNADLNAANKELESFSYSVSHDLRAPLRAINGYAQMMQEDYTDKLDDQGRRFLAVIRESGLKMGALIDDLLEFSRLSRKPIAVFETDMNALVQEVLRDLHLAAGDSTTRCVVEPLPVVSCDRALLRQVWHNLLSNALKFAGKREQPAVKVSGQTNGKEFVYSVSDNGAGFDMKYYDKLFGVFQRLHSNEEFPGTGVGLAIVQRVVTRHGGRVWAEGKVDAGATFYFALPRETAGG